MPRSVPTIDGTPNMRRISMRFVDRSNDVRSVSFYVELGATAAQIEALVAAVGAATNANLFELEDVALYRAARLASGAISAPEISVYDNIVILYKESSSPQGQDFFLPAPIRLNFVGDTDNPDPESDELGAVRDAVTPLMLGTVVPISMRYSERREKNQSVSAT